jgi:hypothetical protein
MRGEDAICGLVQLHRFGEAGSCRSPVGGDSREGEVAQQFLAAVPAQPKVKRLLSSEHFSVGTLLEVWVCVKSFRPKDGSGNAPQSRRTANATFTASAAATIPTPRPPTPTSRLLRKGPGKQARFCFMGNVLMENRNRLATPSGWPR